MTTATEPRTFRNRRRSTRPDNDPQAPRATQSPADLFAHWRLHPHDFIDQAILAPYNAANKTTYRMTTQQREATEAVRALVEAKIAVHRGDATPEHVERAKKLGVSIMAGKGIGKDAWMSWIIMWFTLFHPYAKVPCTSVSADQIQKVLWSELAKWLHTSLVAPFFKLQADKLFYLDLPAQVQGRRWFAFPKTANPKAGEQEQTEGSAGIHENYVMVAVDEASGLSDAEFQPFESTLTGMCNFFVMIFNPTRATGYAVRTHEEDAPYWVTMRWNAEDSEIGNKAVQERLLEKYGRDSNPYRIRVLGLPPITDAQTLIPWDWIQEAKERELEGYENELLVKGVDCGAGGDKSIIVSRRGYYVYPIHRLVSPDSQVLTNWVGTDIDADHPDQVYVDTVGIGWAVEGQLRQLKGAAIQAADARRTADRDDKYFNKRAEMYDRVREAFERGVISIPDDSDLIDQLSVIQVEYVGSKMKVLDKKKLKKLIKDGHSPDEADALALTFYRDPRFQTRAVARTPSKPIRRASLAGDWFAGRSA
ncbi:MAG: hypothetical protein EPN22_17270 [Nitrospirae bacterium]|nr:MAG: hypothetical protein EPN22_17270 [Nitrospirota bacterium]